MTDERYQYLTERAIDLGQDAGLNAASWCYDGNTDKSWFAYILKGIEDGDPMILDSFRVPDLSGEYSGDPTPSTLVDDLGIEDTEEDSDAISDFCDAYANAASDAFWSELERVCRLHAS